MKHAVGLVFELVILLGLLVFAVRFGVPAIARMIRRRLRRLRRHGPARFLR